MSNQGLIYMADEPVHLDNSKEIHYRFRSYCQYLQYLHMPKFEHPYHFPIKTVKDDVT